MVIFLSSPAKSFTSQYPVSWRPYNCPFHRSSPRKRRPTMGLLLTARLPLWNVHASADRLRTAFNPRERALSKSASRARLAEIIRKRSFGRGEITLASGRKSDFYFNLKPTMLDPERAALLAALTHAAARYAALDFVGGLEMGAVPLAGAIAQLSL